MVAAVLLLQSGLFYWIYELQDLGECEQDNEEEKRDSRALIDLHRFYNIEYYSRVELSLKLHILRH
jgi:hypothetical protein